MLPNLGLLHHTVPVGDHLDDLKTFRFSVKTYTSCREVDSDVLDAASTDRRDNRGVVVLRVVGRQFQTISNGIEELLRESFPTKPVATVVAASANPCKPHLSQTTIAWFFVELPEVDVDKLFARFTITDADGEPYAFRSEKKDGGWRVATSERKTKGCVGGVCPIRPTPPVNGYAGDRCGAKRGDGGRGGRGDRGRGGSSGGAGSSSVGNPHSKTQSAANYG